MKGITVKTMLYSFKIGTKYIAFDTESLMAYTLSELEQRMIEFIGGELPEACPSALRYELAKYDSNTVDSAYARVYAMHTGTADTGVHVPVNNDMPDEAEAVVCSASESELAGAVIKLADAGSKVIALADGIEPDAGTYERLAREVYKRKRIGKPFVFVPFIINEDDIKKLGTLEGDEKKRVECGIFVKLP